MSVPDGATPQVSGQGSRLLLSVALPFLGPQRLPLGPQLPEGKREKRIVCGKVSWVRCSVHAPLARTQSCVLINQREAGQWRPACAPGGQS